MAITKVDLNISQLLEDLSNGLTWLKSEDLGYGSIQQKYDAKDQQIAMIRKHPKLKDAEPTVVVFNIIDDTETPAQKADKVMEVINSGKTVDARALVGGFEEFSNL